MLQYEIVNESSEDTLEWTNNLQDAVRMARDFAIQGPIGDLVSILQKDGRAIRQFLRTPDGSVAEQPITGQSKREAS